MILGTFLLYDLKNTQLCFRAFYYIKRIRKRVDLENDINKTKPQIVHAD